MELSEIATFIGLGLNLLATIGAYVKLRLELEHRLTTLETLSMLSQRGEKRGE